MSLKQNSVLSAVFSRNIFKLDSVPGVVTVGLLLAVFLTGATFTMLNVQRQEASLVLAFDGEEKSRMFQGEVVENMTVLQALIASSRAGQIKLEYYFDSDNKVVIKELNGYTKAKDKELAFYLNGSKIDISNINKTPIRGGDRIEVRSE